MSEKLQFHHTTDFAQLLKVFSIGGSEWSRNLSPEDWGKLQADISHDPENVTAFYLTDSAGEIVSTAVVKRVKAFKKETERVSAINSVPDPSFLGVKTVTALQLSHVFTHRDYRKKDVASDIVSKAIEFTEAAIITEHLEKSDASKNDNFKNMVTTDGAVDRQLANHYLAKQYFWFLYTSAGKFFEKFGFVAYPLNFYQIPTSVCSQVDEKLVDDLVNSSQSDNPNSIGKKLRFLHGKNKPDVELISIILQGVELEILTDLNKSIFHSELSGDRKSSSSLTNLSEVLHMSKLGSSGELSAIPEQSRKASDAASRPRRKSSIHHLTVPKIALKPSLKVLDGLYRSEEETASHLAENVRKYYDVKGAILTNDLQQKTYYILWTSFLQSDFYILNMGELKVDIALPFDYKRRRGSSSAGLNELGGYNLQDLNLLIHAAVVVAKRREVDNTASIYVSANDLPSNIPAPVIHDYFLHYLPNAFENVARPDDEAAPDDIKVKYIDNAIDELKFLPSVKTFGSKKLTTDVDWVANGMLYWDLLREQRQSNDYKAQK